MKNYRLSHRTFGLFIRFVVISNVLVFLGWNSFGDPHWMATHFLVSWDALEAGRWWTLWTSAFSHSQLWHLILNIFVLTNFAGAFRGQLNVGAFALFYFVACGVSSLAHSLISLEFLGTPELPALGASGGVCAVIMLFALSFPRRKILILGLIPAPALFATLALVGLDLWGLSAQIGGAGLPIGHGAHIGGTLTGALAYFLFFKKGPTMSSGQNSSKRLSDHINSSVWEKSQKEPPRY